MNCAFVRNAFAAICLGGLVGMSFGQASTPSATAFGSLPAQTDVVLTSDGHYLAWADQRSVPTKLDIFDLAAHKMQRIIDLPDRGKLRGLSWSDGDTLIVLMSEAIDRRGGKTAYELAWTLAYDAAGGDGRILPAMGENRRGAFGSATAHLVSVHGPDPRSILMTIPVGKNAERCLTEVSTVDGTYHIIKCGTAQTAAWVVDTHGTAVAREDWDVVHHAWCVYALLTDKPRELLCQDDAIPPPNLAGALPDDSAVLVLAENGRPHQVAWAYPLDGSPAHVLVEDADSAVSGVYADPYSGIIIGVFLGGSATKIDWLDQPAEQRYQSVQRAFPGKAVALYGWTGDGSKTLAYVEAADSAPVYYLIDFTTHRADIAAEPYPDLAGVKLGEVKEIHYSARDGTKIPAYLTLPPAAASEPLPLVVLPHGGPNARDYYPSFDFVAQFLASRGYAVLQPQFRGSTGFGDAFERAGFRQWGGLMQDDVTDGVQAMVEQRIADPHHICIAGFSYGGYAALAGAAFTPQLYSCAVSVSGVSDIPGFLRAVLPHSSWLGSFGYVRVFSSAADETAARIGSANDAKLAAKSPINAISAISIPVLIMYGTDDAVVPNEQSERMAQALAAAKKPVTVVKLPAEDHWLSHTQARVQVLTSLESFLGEHLKVMAPAQAPQ
jgi:dienelactone hydrolase